MGRLVTRGTGRGNDLSSAFSRGLDGHLTIRVVGPTANIFKGG